MKDPMNSAKLKSAEETTASKKGPWLWVLALIIVVAIFAFWFNGSRNAAPTTSDLQGNDVEQITDTTPLPAEETDPNPVPPQDALIPPAPVPAAPSE